MLLYLGLSLYLSTVAAHIFNWTLVQNGTSGIVAIELVPVSPTLMLMFDRTDEGNALLLPDGTPAWAALWNLDTNTPTALSTLTDTFCASAGFISNGTLVSIAGNPVRTVPPRPRRPDGNSALRSHLHLQAPRWYPTALRIPDGSLMVMGGSSGAGFSNTPDIAENSIEFHPSKESQTRPSQFLVDTMPGNFFPRAFLLPSGRVFVVANNASMLYDIESNTETRLPPIPNGVHVTNPFDGTAQLLPLSPPDYEATVLVCGGSAVEDDNLPAASYNQTDPASDQCARMTLTPEGISQGWTVETMPERRILLESVLLPNGDVIFLNGAHNGYSGYRGVAGSNSTSSNAINPAFRPILYQTAAPEGSRLTQQGLPESTIPRMYHSTASLTGSGAIMIAGSGPTRSFSVAGTPNVSFPTEYRVEYLQADFTDRPSILSSPVQILFNESGELEVDIPASLADGQIQVSLMDMGFATHAWHTSSRLVFLEHELNGRTLDITAPPNGNIYPPGPAWIFVVVDGVYSEGVQVMIGDGGDPPRAAQGVELQLNSI
ncbi:hypothetical protein MKEN_00424100 [Mycena kentingensis (nom. inval.)]|nr:hypothetical protein MKEN_00424100 [Mycena kentingensis (nom. inval.)]